MLNGVTDCTDSSSNPKHDTDMCNSQDPKSVPGEPSTSRAIKCYALFHQLDPSTVTEAIVQKSSDGLIYWANYGLDHSARGSIGQQIHRALLKNPQVKGVYKWLTEDLKKKFRMTWAVERNFDQVLKTRVRSIKQIRSHTELGSFKSELQLQVHFGGADHPEAIRQASAYIGMCKKFADT